MAEAFKHLINAQTVAAVAQQMQQAWPGFAAQAFTRHALAGLETLELKARAMQLADALAQTLPADFEQAAALIEATLAPPTDPDAPATPQPVAQGLSGWALWSVGEVVAQRALAEPAQLPRALQTLHALTQRFTAEFAIRPLLRDHPGLVLATLATWVDDPSAHVRRLVSEGSRPRLPWGLRLQALVADPRPTLPLLAALQDDPSAYVRRSVANHLNDMAKDHPDQVADWLAQYLPGASAQRRALLKHASRSLIKQGHPRVLAAWGVGGGFVGTAALRLSADTVTVGESLELVVVLRSQSAQPQRLVVDYGVAHQGAHGLLPPKVFKGWTLELAAGEHRVLTRRHALRPLTTRRYYPGWHGLRVQINGLEVAQAGFVLQR